MVVSPSNILFGDGSVLCTQDRELYRKMNWVGYFEWGQLVVKKEGINWQILFADDFDEKCGSYRMIPTFKALVAYRLIQSQRWEISRVCVSENACRYHLLNKQFELSHNFFSSLISTCNGQYNICCKKCSCFFSV